MYSIVYDEVNAGLPTTSFPPMATSTIAEPSRFHQAPVAWYYLTYICSFVKSIEEFARD
jgi:hypothetical protein